MKTTILLCAIIILSLGSCCNKSSHCVVTDSSGNTVKDYGTKKGTTADVKNYENSCKSDATQYNGTMTCNGMMMH